MSQMKINNRLKSGKNKKNMKYLKIIDPMDAIDVSMEANKQLAIKGKYLCLCHMILCCI